MTARDLFWLVLSNLRRMVGRVIFTALGVVIGTAAIVILISMGSGLQRFVNDNLTQGPVNQITVFGGAFVGSTDEESLLTPRALREFEAIEGVEAVTPQLNINAPTELSVNRYVVGASLTGIEPLAFDDLGLTVAEGSPNLSRNTVIVGGRVAESLIDERTGIQPFSAQTGEEPPGLFGQTLNLTVRRLNDDGEEVSRTERLRVGAVLEENGQNDFDIYMALGDMEDINNWVAGTRVNREREGYNQVVVITERDPQVTQQVEAAITDQGYFAFSIGSQLQSINIVFLVIQAILGGIGAIALLVAAIGIGNTMVMSVLERTREIGLMKAVGASNRDILTVFLTEAGVIGLLGGIVGLLVGIIISLIIDIVARNAITAQVIQGGGAAPEIDRLVVTPLWLMAFALAFSLVIGLVAGIFPAFRAIQLDPVRALKHE